ncbi:MAG TPA: DUF5819 family protein, partial [Nitrosopumilaceae archaeon]|nr:DUF5819 family protein [Nitrosopumilaceae archaeon]
VKKYLPLVAFFFLVGHFSLILIYAFPPPLMLDKFQKQAQRYTEPLFEQYWSLFAPTPKINKSLYYRIIDEKNNPGPWLSPYNEDLKNHYSGRIFSSGRKVILYSDLLHFLLSETCPCKFENKFSLGNMSNSSFNALTFLIQKEIGNNNKKQKVDIAVVCSELIRPFEPASARGFILLYPAITLSH